MPFKRSNVSVHLRDILELTAGLPIARSTFGNHIKTIQIVTGEEVSKKSIDKLMADQVTGKPSQNDEYDRLFTDARDILIQAYPELKDVKFPADMIPKIMADKTLEKAEKYAQIGAKVEAWLQKQEKKLGDRKYLPEPDDSVAAYFAAKMGGRPSMEPPRAGN